MQTYIITSRRCRFAPHFHPGAAEYFLGIRGKTNLVAYINSKLVRCRSFNVPQVFQPQQQRRLLGPKRQHGTAAPELWLR